MEGLQHRLGDLLLGQFLFLPGVRAGREGGKAQQTLVTCNEGILGMDVNPVRIEAAILILASSR